MGGRRMGEWDGGVGGGIFALRRPRPYSRRLRGCPCVSHCDPDAAIAAASMPIPFLPHPIPASQFPSIDS